MRSFVILGACLGSLLMTSCSTPAGPNEYNGTMLGAGGGAIVGGLIGSSFGGSRGALAGAALGALAGGAAGKAIGSNQDQQARAPDYRYRQDPRYVPADYDDYYGRPGYYR